MLNANGGRSDCCCRGSKLGWGCRANLFSEFPPIVHLPAPRTPAAHCILEHTLHSTWHLEGGPFFWHEMPHCMQALGKSEVAAIRSPFWCCSVQNRQVWANIAFHAGFSNRVSFASQSHHIRITFASHSHHVFYSTWRAAKRSYFRYIHTGLLHKATSRQVL